ncbi:phosphatidylinositol-specific phospholipase C/glycerophosphodiester phosphodiesterase family protein [Sporobolomyces salmoneus]|uniref:phosphatidylinositol-specific phospholipase C/glycerophosphodiester phosphodiesterase family protein n=1 Tax=Sporobolomyces salmoneus TaxID=183962 RepID=UPI00316D8E86
MAAIPVLSSSPLISSSSISKALLFARSSMQAISGLIVQSDATALTYPTSLTRDIVPKNIHSHNDYWRQVPLFDALSFGCKSFEADIHLVGSGNNTDLLVGHKSVSLSLARTLKSLYLDPLEEILDLQNPQNALAANEPNETVNGVYDYDPEQTVQFLLDYKTDGAELHDAVISYLSHFRSRDLLSYYDAETGQLTVRAITIVCTGNCPVELVKQQQPRFIFYDTPLADIESIDYGSEVAPLSSTSLRKMFGTLGSFDLEGDRSNEIRRLVDIAHSKGIKTRFWETPGWPAFKRDSTWRTLLDNGVDWINADNLLAASKL